MKKLIVLVVLAGAGFGAYKIAFAKSEAYVAYEAFSNAVLHLQYQRARDFVHTDDVHRYINDAKSPAKFFGALEWEKMNTILIGPVRDIVEEEVLEDGAKVRLKVIQEVRKGRVNIGAFGPLNFRETHDVVMVKTDEGWMVESFEAEVERICDR